MNYNFIKYKNKYLELKGGNILNSGVFGSKYTEIEYRKLHNECKKKYSTTRDVNL